MALDEPQRAAEAYREATARDPCWDRAQNNLGLALERLANLAQAEKHDSRAVHINPSHQPLRRNLDRLRAERRNATVDERP